MVTPQGFNALLKIVEEPPEHVKFVFATTEPEKVIGTIRSRTHHYPFRLVPPGQLHATTWRSSASREEVAVAPGVLSFVVRAGGGSVRDSLSVLDQLIAGSGDDGPHLRVGRGAARLHRRRAARRHDRRASPPATRAAVFRSIDKVIETGLDPRRFVEDLLERLRDLIVVAAVPDGASAVLRGTCPRTSSSGCAQQAAAFGAGRPVAGRRHRQRRPHRDDRRHRPAPAARAHRRPHPAARRRRREPGMPPASTVSNVASTSAEFPRRRRSSAPSSAAARSAPQPPVAARAPVGRPASGRPPVARRPREPPRACRPEPVRRASRRPTAEPDPPERAPPRAQRARRARHPTEPPTAPAPHLPTRAPTPAPVAAAPPEPAGAPARAPAASTPPRSAGPGPTSSPVASSRAQARHVDLRVGARPGRSTTTASGVLLGISTVGLANTFRRGPHADLRPPGPHRRPRRRRPRRGRARPTRRCRDPGAPAGVPTSTRQLARDPAPPSPPTRRRPAAQPRQPRRRGRPTARAAPRRRERAARASRHTRRPAARAQALGERAPHRAGPSWSEAPPRRHRADVGQPARARQGRGRRRARVPRPRRVVDDTAISDDDESIDDLGDVGVPVVERVLGGHGHPRRGRVSRSRTAVEPRRGRSAVQAALAADDHRQGQRPPTGGRPPREQPPVVHRLASPSRSPRRARSSFLAKSDYFTGTGISGRDSCAASWRHGDAIPVDRTPRARPRSRSTLALEVLRAGQGVRHLPRGHPLARRAPLQGRTGRRVPRRSPPACPSCPSASSAPTRSARRRRASRGWPTSRSPSADPIQPAAYAGLPAGKRAPPAHRRGHGRHRRPVRPGARRHLQRAASADRVDDRSGPRAPARHSVTTTPKESPDVRTDPPWRQRGHPAFRATGLTCGHCARRRSREEARAPVEPACGDVEVRGRAAVGESVVTRHRRARAFADEEVAAALARGRRATRLRGPRLTGSGGS